MGLNCKVRVLVIGLLVSCCFQLSAADSLRTEKEGDKYFVIHRVEKGETLYSLSKRYGASLDQIKDINEIENNKLALDQELRIPIQSESVSPAVKTAEAGADREYHEVRTGETLYAISRKYGATVDQLRAWNDLTSNEISIGQMLVVNTGERAENPPLERNTEEAQNVEGEVAESTGEPEERDTNNLNDSKGFTEYYVQSGEMLGSIAKKFNVRPDSIVLWNDLPNTYLAIGQKLLIKGEIDKELLKESPKITTRPYGSLHKTTDPSGFVKVFEEGVASQIDNAVETEKYLVLHRTLPMGALVEVRNLMNNQKVFARVVGKLPETGLNEKVLVRLTPVCFKRLGVIDSKARVEVSYYEE